MVIIYFFRNLAIIWLHLVLSFFIVAQSKTECCPSLDHESWSVHEVVPGIKLFQQHFNELFGIKQFVSILAININQENVKMGVTASYLFEEDQLTVPELAKFSNAMAAVNGGFAHGGPKKVNSGILKIKGQILPFLQEEPEELHFVGSSAIGIDTEGRLHFRQRSGNRWDNEWKEMKYALAGGHRLLDDGDIFSIVENEKYVSDREIRHAVSRHPRTAIGIRPDNVAILITIDGRHPSQSIGLTLYELAQMLKALGCTDAINLDGGGSTTMWVRNYGVINHPSDNGQFDKEGVRNVRSAVIISVEFNN